MVRAISVTGTGVGHSFDVGLGLVIRDFEGLDVGGHLVSVDLRSSVMDRGGTNAHCIIVDPPI